MALPVVVALVAFLALANAASRPAFLAYGSDLAPGQAPFGLIGLSNQSGLVIGSSWGRPCSAAGYRGFAIAALCQRLLAAGLALPLLRPSRAR
jgi:hypothetical protein